MNHTIHLSISGLGIIMYSPGMMPSISEGTDFLSTEFWEPTDVARHVLRGDLTTFCTGTGGTFQLHVADGPADEATLQSTDFKVRLALEVRGGQVCFRDLYDLMEWTSTCPSEQTIALPDGFYRVTVFSNVPPSGILGDDQDIVLQFERAPQLPELRWDGVPQLCK